MTDKARKVREQLDQKRADDKSTTPPPESPRDVMHRVSNDVVKQIKDLFEKKEEQKSK